MIQGIYPWTLVLLSLSLLPNAAVAQQLITDQAVQSTADALKVRPDSRNVVDGITIAPGIILSVGVGTEAGYDNNPNQLDGGVGSAFSRTTAFSQITAIREKSLTRFRLEGDGVFYGDGDVGRTERGLGQISAEHFQDLGAGWSLSFGGLYRYNGLRYVEDEVAGAYTELGFRDANVVSFLRGRFTGVRYLTDVPPPSGVPALLSPLFRTSAFDVDKSEVNVGVLIGASSPIAAYFEGAVADLNYVNEPLTSVVHRDASDAFGKVGLRFAFAPSLQVDAGWRFNTRDLSDPVVDSYSSNDFDFGLRWSPWTYFTLTAAIDRTLQEPSVALSRVADTKTYSLAWKYALDSQIALQSGVKRRVFDEIGGAASFRIWELDGEVTYDATRWSQYYIGLLYQGVYESVGDSAYEQLRIGAGLRVRFSDDRPAFRDMVIGERTVSPLNVPQGTVLDVTVGPSWLSLPGKKLTTQVGGVFFDEALGQITDHAGDMPGVKTSVDIGRIASYEFSGGRSLSFGLSTSYGYYKSDDRSSCDFTLTTDCAFVNVVDFDPANENNTGPFGRLRTKTEREVHYWSVAPYAHLGHFLGGGLKDGGVRSLSPFYAGVDFRGLNERTHLHAVDVSVPDPVDMNESLDTYYLGGFVGYKQSFPLGRGWSLGVDGRAGVYHAHTSLDARYLAYVPAGGGVFILEQGREESNRDEAAFIGSIGLNLAKDLGWAKVGFAGSVDYLSYVPEVRYNNDDFAGGSPFGIVGTQRGTVIGSSDAWSATIGLSLSVPLTR